MKKLLVLLTVMVAIVGFSTSAFAVYGEPICSTCKGDTIGKISCTPVQGGTCDPFDYETRSGYCGVTTPLDLYASKARAIFSVCNCLNAGTTFVEYDWVTGVGGMIGVRMTILVNGKSGENGAYWSAGATANVPFGMYATTALACAATIGTPMDRSFGPGKFYKSDLTTEVAPGKLIGSGTCVVPAASQATVIATNPSETIPSATSGGYAITAFDVRNKLSRLWIDIPPIRIDPNVLHNGETISVKIETLDQLSGGICADCVATCECTIVVAQVCCAATAACTFPYFSSTTAATATQPFWNGIAIVNTGKVAGTATFTVYQQDGKTGTYTTPSVAAGSMYVKPLQDIPFVGTGLGGLPVYIDVFTTFGAMDGFAIMANTATGESMGYLCRKP